MPKRLLLRGGHVLTMDPALGDVFAGDVLIEGDRIAAVGRSLDAGDAEVIDAADCIVIPGFIDSHRHTWETVIRGIAPDVSLGGYFEVVLNQLAPAYRAEDVYAGCCEDGTWWFWWSWAERIAAATELDRAAERVVHVLSAPHDS